MLNFLEEKEIPLVLHMRLESTYPSKDPPFIQSIDPSWYPEGFQNDLKALLLEVWDQNAGDLILYKWWECVSSLDILPMLERYSEGLSIASEEIQALREMQSVRNQKKFEASYHDCGVCLSEHHGSNMVRFQPCGHVSCKDCLGRLCSLRIKEGSVSALRCPESGCTTQIPPHVVSELVDKAQLERYETLTLQNALNAMSDVVYCPINTCSAPVLMESDEDFGVCPSCNFCFCVFCKKASHGLTPCVNPEEVKKIKKMTLDEREQKFIALRAEKEARRHAFMTYSTIRSTTRLCPNCKVAIEKNGGCDHMFCSNCQKPFLWSMALMPGTKLNKLTEREKRPKEDKALGRQIEKSKPCPGCFRRVEREFNNSNHIHCVCGASFCFLCGAVAKGTAHFMIGNCKQHSPPSAESSNAS
jgi:E3 ubiquitin-protein ligase RNF14